MASSRPESRANALPEKAEKAAGGGDIPVTMTRLDGDCEIMHLKLSKQTSVSAIKQRIEMQFAIATHEQLLIFRGQILTKDAFQPLRVPDLQDIIKESGEAGLQMAVKYQPKMLPPFMKRQGLHDANAKVPTGATALHRAVRRCELSVVEELLGTEDFGSVNGRDQSGQTALHTAVSCRLREAVEIILMSERFNMPATADSDGQTPLHIAAHWGDLKVCSLILNHLGFTIADRDVVDNLGYTALAYAKECGHDDVVDLLENYVEVAPT